MPMSESDSKIPISWVSVHHRPLQANWTAAKGRMMSLDDGLLSDVQNRHNLYHYEEYDINEEDDDVFIDSVNAIVSQHQRSLATRRVPMPRARVSSEPEYRTATVVKYVYLHVLSVYIGQVYSVCLLVPWRQVIALYIAYLQLINAAEYQRTAPCCFHRAQRILVR